MLASSKMPKVLPGFAGVLPGFAGAPPVGRQRVEDAAGRQRVEDALESFLLRLPPWRGGQRDVGRSVSMSPERNGRAKGGGDDARWRARSRSRSRRRPSPVPAKARKGSMFDIGPGRGGPEQLRDTKEKKEKKEKRERRSPSRGGRKASSGRDSRSPSRPKKRKEAKRESRSASHGKKRKGDKDKDKDRGKEKDRDRSGSHRSQRDRKHKARDRKSASPRSPSRGSGTGERRAGSNPAAEKLPGGKDDEDVPEWLSDLFQAPGNVAASGGPVGTLLRPRVPHREVIVPQQLVARLIGKGGEVIMGICNATGADVKIRQETKDMGYSLAIITGHNDAMDTAEAMVRQKLGV